MTINPDDEMIMAELSYIQSNFIKHFGTSKLFINITLSDAIGKYTFDVLAFDKWLHHEHGYEENKHGSIREFVNFKFGEESVSFLVSLMKGH